ncbi:MAG: DUF3054 domain-containing protein [Candidatus Microthrix subdominans]
MALETEPVPQRSDADTRRSPGSALALTAVADVAVILAFVLMGRNNHDEGLSPASVLGVAAPFLIAAALSWAALVLWHRSTDGEAATPTLPALRSVWPDGVAVWLGTAVLGLVLRGLVFGDGTAASFVIVTSAVLGVGLIGWRVAVGVRSNSAGS